ncbi:MAG: amidoligase family protein [Anaeroplasmataceae bacterium]
MVKLFRQKEYNANNGVAPDLIIRTSDYEGIAISTGNILLTQTLSGDNSSNVFFPYYEESNKYVETTIEEYVEILKANEFSKGRTYSLNEKSYDYIIKNSIFGLNEINFPKSIIDSLREYTIEDIEIDENYQPFEIKRDIRNGRILRALNYDNNNAIIKRENDKFAILVHDSRNGFLNPIIKTVTDYNNGRDNYVVGKHYSYEIISSDEVEKLVESIISNAITNDEEYVFKMNNAIRYSAIDNAIVRIINNIIEKYDLDMCDDCGDMYLNTEFNTTNSDNKVCDNCYENYSTCNDCGELYHESDIYYTSNDTSICSHCSDGYAYCEDCCTYIPFSDVEDNNGLCENCSSVVDESLAMGDYLYNYSYKPKPIFFGKDKTSYDEDGVLYMGIELEVEPKSSHSVKDRRCFVESLSTERDYIYCKLDGSVADGFEIVTHPCTVDFHKENFPDMLSELKSNGYISHNVVDGASFHIHVNKTYFGKSEEEKELAIAKIVLIFEKHWDVLVTLSRRTYSQLHWCKRPSLDMNDDNVKDYKNMVKQYKMVYDRHRAINLQNSHTVEFRLWRGTLNKNTAFAMMDLTKIICDIAKEKTIEEILTINSFVALIEDKFDIISEYWDNRGICRNR